MEKKNNVIKCIRYSLFVLHLWIGILALVKGSFEIALLCVTVFWFHNILFSLERWNSRFIFFFFHCMIFMFLMVRPIISIFKGYTWKYYTDAALRFTFVSLWITLLSMFVGVIMYEQYHACALKRSRSKTIISKKTVRWYETDEFRKSLQLIAVIVYCISFVAYFYLQMEKYMFMRGKVYNDFYTSFENTAPYIVQFLASFRTYSLAIYLSTAPKKKSTFLILSSFILADFPVLLYGKRSLIMTDALFILVYYILRNGMGEQEKWLGKVEKTCVFIGAPLALVAMGAMNYIRAGSSVSTKISDLLLDFFFKQGVSFNVLNLGYESIPFLPQRRFRNYTFGSIIDYFAHGSFAQKFFHAEDLGSGNNLLWALKSNSFAHNMSYIEADDYLEGHGLGSSYILEVFADYGYIGIILFSILLGVILIWFVNVMRKMNFGSMIVINIIMNIFFMPRGEATGCITFLVYAQFWVIILVAYMGAALIARTYSYKSLKMKGIEENV